MIDAVPFTSMATARWLLLGFVLGAAFLAVARAQGQGEARVLAIGLIVAAGFYVGFALMGAAASWVLIEAAGVVVFGAAAWLGLRRSPLWLSAGWALHPVWDAGLHLFGGGSAFAPAWYALLCITFDVLVAGYVALRLRPTHAHPGPP